jgi:hypothetical protein
MSLTSSLMSSSGLQSHSTARKSSANQFVFQCQYSTTSKSSPKTRVLPHIQALTLELMRDRIRKGLATTIRATEHYIKSCRGEIDQLAKGSSDDEPQELADHRANLTEFLHDEVEQASEHAMVERDRLHALRSPSILPVLESFPELNSPISMVCDKHCMLRMMATN